MYYLLITIINRESSEEFLKFFSENRNGELFLAPCTGTAQQKTLDLLGLEKTEKTVLFAVSSADTARTLLHSLKYVMNIDIPGYGIAMTVPLTAFGGISSKEQLTGVGDAEERKMENNEYRYSLIIAISEKGTSGMVMDAARKADARGGTVVHVKGTGTENVTKFLGVTVANEREMTLIAARKEKKAAIMQAIIDEAGINTEAKTVMFALPVENIAGLRSFEQDD